MPGAVRGREEPAAIARGKRVGARQRKRIERRADDRRVRGKHDERSHRVRTIRTRPIRMVVLLALRPAVIGNAGVCREIIEKLVRVPEGEIVLPGPADPHRLAPWVHGERDTVSKALRALTKFHSPRLP